MVDVTGVEGDHGEAWAELLPRAVEEGDWECWHHHAGGFGRVRLRWTFLGHGFLGPTPDAGVRSYTNTQQ